MRRTRELVGMAVVAESGETLGRIGDLLFDPDRGHVDGVIVHVDWRSWLGDGRVLPFAQIYEMGEHRVIARQGVELLAFREWRMAGHRTDCSSSGLQGRPVLTTAGRRVGTVSDTIVNAETGRLDGLELAARRSDESVQPSLVRVTADVRIGDDAIVIPDDVA